jgi:hypothetical protein
MTRKAPAEVLVTPRRAKCGQTALTVSTLHYRRSALSCQSSVLEVMP